MLALVLPVLQQLLGADSALAPSKHTLNTPWSSTAPLYTASTTPQQLRPRACRICPTGRDGSPMHGCPLTRPGTGRPGTLPHYQSTQPLLTPPTQTSLLVKSLAVRNAATGAPSSSYVFAAPVCQNIARIVPINVVHDTGCTPGLVQCSCLGDLVWILPGCM